MVEEKSFTKQWWKLKWHLGILIAIIVASPFISYHFFFKDKIVKEVEVVKEVVTKDTIRVQSEVFSCQFIECYEYRGFSLYYQYNKGCCHDLQLVISYDTRKEYLLLRNAVGGFKKWGGDYYDGCNFNNGQMSVLLDQVLSGAPFRWIKAREVYLNNPKKINQVYKIIDQSFIEMGEMFCEQNK